MSNPHQDVPGHMNLKKLKELRDSIDIDVKIILNHIGPINKSLVNLENFENLIIPKDREIVNL
jgi:hypothetical protein